MRVVPTVLWITGLTLVWQGAAEWDRRHSNSFAHLFGDEPPPAGVVEVRPSFVSSSPINDPMAAIDAATQFQNQLKGAPKIVTSAPVGLGSYLRPPYLDIADLLLGSELSKDCHTYITKVANMSFSKDETLVRNLPVPSAKCNVEDESVAADERAYIKGCLVGNHSQDTVATPECIRSFILYRSALISFLAQKKPPTKDAQTLAHLLYFYWSEQKLQNSKPETKDRYLEIARLLGSVDDKQGVTQKILVRHAGDRLLLMGPGMEPQDRENAWKELEKQAGSDASDLGLWVRTRGFDETRMALLAKDLLLQTPDSRPALLLLAFSHWKKLETEEAFKAVKKGAAPEKGDGLFSRLLRDLIQPHAGKEVFLKIFQIEVTADDFDK